MKRALQIVITLVFASLFIMACTGPDGDPGDPGAPGIDGAPGPSVYLIDENGIRYYSGAVIFLGYVRQGFAPDIITTNFYLVNESGADITISGAPTITLTDEMYESPTGAITYVTTTLPTNNVITVTYPTLEAVLPRDATSEAIAMTVDATTGWINIKETRRYLIEMSDGVDSYDFVFETYGFSVSSGGW